MVNPSRIRLVSRLPATAPAVLVTDTADLLKRSGPMRFGQGMIATVLALSLGFLCLLGVIAFHYPQYLTTPELRHQYSVDVLRQMMFWALIVAGGLSLASIIIGNRRNLNVLAFVLVAVAVALGGSRVPVDPNFPDHTPYIGLDWFILDLLGSTLLFVVIEKLFPLYRGQAVFRPEWQTDLKHFTVNHFLVGLILLTVNFLINHAFGWMVRGEFQQAVRGIPFVWQLLLCILVADFAQYWTHRAYHEV